MSRVINPDSAGKERTRLTKAVVIAIRELAKQSVPSDASRDMAAFIALALGTIAEGIDVSVAAWEKRNYWVKADRFRMDWAWAGQLGEKMKTAVLEDDWASVAMLSAQIAQKLNKVKVSEKHRMGKPWVGACNELEK
jgi:DNA-directed RNA polymerase subunit K/omega